ncbi:hypothetical protein GCM10010172_74910 [Paractinoplanes ferrugineus]|uniref:2'-5' RNA ligase superfamily protein n=1 Tax=Paractinoplanes ferrugineus TaxID=113564 RepID=A0A919J098_9ACTN|nr:2'-5' RNA ligase family protein [Actinoplanes ferrugineus]GIE11354.1 hypothetical protein Afe05nite_31940 [Actinoplanes ferrugineus]
MRTVELLLDPELEHDVREVWGRLRAAGLPSLAGHPHPTNRPHLTVVTAASIDGLPPLPLPVPIELGVVRFLGRALIWAVTPTAALRDIHATAWSALRNPWPSPADWMPHVSLALKVPPGHRPALLEALTGLAPAAGRCESARSYDSLTRTVVDLQ